MRLPRSLILTLAVSALSACVTTEEDPQRIAGLSADSQKSVEEADTAASDGEKASLDASVQKYRTVTLVDEKTGKPKVICKRVRQPGTLFETKVCASKDEWVAARQEAKDKTDDIQRNMDARCGAAGC